MKVLVFCVSGLIGRSVVSELINRRYDVLALSRSKRSADSLRQVGATVLTGNLYTPKTG